MDIDFETQKKNIYIYDVNSLKNFVKPYTKKFLISPLFCSLVLNISILLVLVAIGFYFGIFASLSYKRLYGDHCIYDADCQEYLNLRCQNGFCNCTTTTFYNQTHFICLPKQNNSIPCSSDNDCCCDQKCSYDLAKNSKLCSCTSDRWWDTNNNICQKKSYFNETCLTSDQCLLETNLVCLSNKCVCSDSNINFWNGTYCDSVQSYMGVCRITEGCSPAQGLICNITEQNPYRCTCAPYYYWDSALNQCKKQLTESDPCTLADQCQNDIGLYCDVKCKCHDNYFWSTNKCIKKINYSEPCGPSLICDNTVNLYCINSYCACQSNNFWNGSYCVSLISNGLNCDNSFECNSNLGLSCDKTSKQCVCSSTHYWSFNQCRLKEKNGTVCIHSIQCQTQNGLSCVTNQCFCDQNYYWSEVNNKCLIKQTVNTWCTETHECQDYNGLECLNTGGNKACECANKRYWNGDQCVKKLSYGEICTLDAECDHKEGLACYGQCRCSSKYYWSGTSCEMKKDKGDNCTQTEECIQIVNLFCISGKCDCMPLMYWSGTNCEFKLPINENCSGSSLACQNYAGLKCTAGLCKCNTDKYWVKNKCQNYVGINQYCDGSTYLCKSGLVCQGTAIGNFICQCATRTYWNGSLCVSLKTYGESCDEWNEPCDYLLNLKCLSNGQGSSCLTGFSGTKCNCNDTDYWNGSTCVSKLLDGEITNDECKCRHDLGLKLLSYSSSYSCYTDYSPDKACVCPNDQYWGGEKCLDKKQYSEYCIESCHCKENLGLTCQVYSNGYSCYTIFASGMKCLCNSDTHWWNTASKKCEKKFIFNDKCSANCECREDLGLTCQKRSGNSCLTDSGNKRCDCGSTQFWSGGICINKYIEGQKCNDDCNCNLDLGLICTGTFCRCQNNFNWDGLQCISNIG